MAFRCLHTSMSEDFKRLLLIDTRVHVGCFCIFVWLRDKSFVHCRDPHAVAGMLPAFSVVNGCVCFVPPVGAPQEVYCGMVVVVRVDDFCASWVLPNAATAVCVNYNVRCLRVEPEHCFAWHTFVHSSRFA